MKDCVLEDVNGIENLERDAQTLQQDGLARAAAAPPFVEDGVELSVVTLALNDCTTIITWAL